MIMIREKEFINLAHVVALRFDPYLSRMKLLLRNGTEICILIPLSGEK